MEKIKELIPKDVETELVFFVNGKKVVEPNPDPEWTLLWYLRRKLHLTGTKYGCGEGGCGACTVMVSQYLMDEDRVNHMAINACLTPVCAIHGLAVTTVEGIGSTYERLHPVQERIAKAHGSQCGFCTPGIVMSMYTLLRNKNKIHYDDIEDALQGNLCRCTGYRPIIESFKTFMEGWEKHYINTVNNNKPCAMGENCCKLKEKENHEEQLYERSSFQPYDPTQEPIFPPELKLNNIYSISYLFLKGENVLWLRPRTLKEILDIKHLCPESKVVAGNTEIGVEMKLKNQVYPVLISPTLIKEMKTCVINQKEIILGAGLSLTEVNRKLQKYFRIYTHEAKILKEIQKMLHWFAGNQVRNVATLAGNVITASPISDLNPIFMSCSAKLNLYNSTRGHRTSIIDDKFFVGYRKTTVEYDEVLVSLEIPLSKENQYFKAYKQAKRKDDDISIVTAAFNVTFVGDIVMEAKLCYGGMAPMTICAKQASKAIKGHHWDKKMLNIVFENLVEDFQLDVSVPGGMADYRKTLSLSLFFKFFLDVYQERNTLNGFLVPNNHRSGANEILRSEPTSSQYFDINNYNCHPSDSIGKPISHMSAFKQATGEAIYCDDLPHIEGELYLKFVFSSEAHAKVIAVDASKALQLQGVVKFLSAVDIDETCNKFGSVLKDEEVFSNEKVTSRACRIGAIVATSEYAAKKGRDLVYITYERLDPVIVTIEDAIEHQSFFDGYPKFLRKGDIETSFMSSKYIKEGHIRSGAQEHFYLETISAFAVRKEDELEIISTSQHPAEIASAVSQVLKIPVHKIVSKVKRIGGGFGGKESKTLAVALPVAIAAYKLRKPVRTVLDREEDMQTTGYRHPFLIKYKVAFNDDGVINGAYFELYANAGYSMDISCYMLERAITHVDNCYFIPNIEIKAYVCKTNLPSNTAFRGFGAPKAMLAAENMIRDIASTLGKSYEEIIERNLYTEGSMTHYNQELTHCTVSRCWKECMESSNYWQRKSEVEQYNRQNRWKKKNISIVPTKYGISFQSDVPMQAGALLLVYNDGSVLLSIGGIEMGQGLFTKMIQVASRALELDISKIHISEMSTDKVPNSSPTAASMSSDLYGIAVVNACESIKNRLQPYKDKNPEGKWEDWVIAAYVDRVSLSTTGFYAAPKIKYDSVKNYGELFEYFTYGVACSEVIIDCLTGDHQVLRTDIVMDVGESLNPAIDIGQIEGAFTQGYGFYTMEEMMFSPTGVLYSRGPGAYKIPGFSDVPKVFNVSLLKGAPNPRAVYSSKAIGEPPLFLAASVYFAIKEAIKSARNDAGVPPEFSLEVPATCARIRMACEDEITEKVKPTITKNGKPWNVTP